MHTLTIQSTRREELIAITPLVSRLVADNGWEKGGLLLFCPHTTAALTVNENADPDVAKDITAFMRKLVPEHSGFSHGEGNSDAHIKTGLFGQHLMLIVEEGTIQLGTWQGIYFCDWDGPRKRSLWAQFLGA